MDARVVGLDAVAGRSVRLVTRLNSTSAKDSDPIKRRHAEYAAGDRG